jgi:hypothetical protein
LSIDAKDKQRLLKLAKIRTDLLKITNTKEYYKELTIQYRIEERVFLEERSKLYTEKKIYKSFCNNRNYNNKQRK